MMRCELCKRLISRSMDSGEALGGRVVRHIGRCAVCKGFYERCLELAGQLADEAKRQRPTVPADLHAKIMRGVRESGSGGRANVDMRRSWRSLGPAMAAAAVLAAILAVQLYQGAKPKPGPGAEGAIGAEAIGWLGAVNATTAASIEETVQWPIREEIRLLGEDGKAAAEFLLACVPIDFDARTENGTP